MVKVFNRSVELLEGKKTIGGILGVEITSDDNRLGVGSISVAVPEQIREKIEKHWYASFLVLVVFKSTKLS